MKKLLVIIAAAALFVACGNQIPTTYQESGELPHIYPDYTNVTVPINIAPLTFEADEKCDGIVARLAVGDEEIQRGLRASASTVRCCNPWQERYPAPHLS